MACWGVKPFGGSLHYTLLGAATEAVLRLSSSSLWSPSHDPCLSCLFTRPWTVMNTNWLSFCSYFWIISISILQVRLRELSGHNQEGLAWSSMKCSENVSQGSSSSNITISSQGAVTDWSLITSSEQTCRECVTCPALARGLGWLEHHSVHQQVAGLIPGQGNT